MSEDNRATKEMVATGNHNNEAMKSKETEIKTIVPDGGWGWVVCGSCLFGNITMGGIFMSFGILLPDLKENFHQGTVIISFIGSIMVGLAFGVGPIVAMMTNKLGLRMVFMMGSIFSGISLLASTFSPNAYFLLLTYGICGGLGLSLMMLPTNIGCNYYFDKKRALATGISKTGVSIGGFIYPPMIDYLLETYDWKMVVYVYSGIAFISCFFGALIRPLELKEIKTGGSEEDDEVTEGSGEHFNKTRRLTLGTLEINNATSLSKNTTIDELPNAHSNSRRRSSIAQLEEYCNLNQGSQRRGSLAQIQGFIKQENGGHTEFVFQPKQRRGSKVFLPALAKLDTFDDGSIFKNKKVHDLPPNEINSSAPDTILGRRRQSVVNLNVFEDTPDKQSVCKKILDFIDPSFWKDPSMMAFLLSRYFGNVSMSVFYMFLPSILLEHGISLAQASLMLTAVNVVNCLARVIVGALMDHPRVNCLLLNGLFYTFGGVIVCIFPFCESYTILMVLGGIIGFMMAPYPVSLAVAVGEMVPREKAVSAMGKLSLGMGLGSISGPVFAGLIFDYSKDHKIILFYDAAAFFLTALCSIISGIINIKRRKNVS